MLRVSVVDLLLPTLTTWEKPIRKSRILLQREVFSPWALSLVVSLEGAVVFYIAAKSRKFKKTE
jgi:hypothetical protein